MKDNQQLTTEKLKRRFATDNPGDRSNFDLVNYAISVAENMVLTGRDCAVRTPIQNRAYQALEELVTGKAKFADVRKEGPAPDLQAPAAKEAILNKARELRKEAAKSDALESESEDSDSDTESEAEHVAERVSS